MNNNQEINNVNQQPNQINNINELDQNVVPIKEVEISQPVNTSINTTSNNNQNIQPPKNNKVSTVLLVILFIFLFLFVIFMPDITKFIENLKTKDEISQIEKDAIEEEKRQDALEKTPEPTNEPTEEVLSELTCVFTNIQNPNYTLTQTQKFTYNTQNQIISSSSLNEYAFVIVDENYESLKQQCNNILNYINHNGYTPACNYENNNIKISHEFNLDTFVPIADTNVITANASYKQNIDEVKNTLITQGYTCK